jgi:hypothetical protein
MTVSFFIAGLSAVFSPFLDAVQGAGNRLPRSLGLFYASAL